MNYRFGRCSLDVDRRELRRDGEICAVEPQVFDLLICLVENRDRVVTKDELIERVWQGRVVSDAALASRISAARHAVGDSGETQEIIRTLPKRGFRFIADVEGDKSEHPAGHQPATPTSLAAGPAQTIRFTTTADGVRLAYAVAGKGPVLVKAANWLNHLEYDWVSPVFRNTFLRLTDHFQLVRYDARGTGLSDWQVQDLSFGTFAADLEAVVAAAEVSRFALLGISQGAALAADYAARFPDQVTHLVLWGGFARGRVRRDNPEEVQSSEAYLTLMRQGWGKSSSAFRRMFASLYLPAGKPEHVDWFTDLQRVAASPENAVRVRRAIDDIDVSDCLARIRAPTLILHSRDEAVVPIDEARFLASRIAGARFVQLDSANHMVLPHEPEWARALDTIVDFLTTDPVSP